MYNNNNKKINIKNHIITDIEFKRPLPLTRKYQIGSKTAPLNYLPDQKVFSSNNVPSEKLKAVSDIKNSLKSNILSLSKPRWNVQTSTGEKICSRRTYVNSVLNRSNMFVYNYRAEKLPSCYPLLPTKSNKFNKGILEVKLASVNQGETFNDKRIAMGISKQIQELPNHPNLLNKEKWNISTDINAFIHKKKFYNNEISRINNSTIKNNLLTKTRISIKQQYNNEIELKRSKILNEKYFQKNALSNMKSSIGLYDRLIEEKKKRENNNDNNKDEL